MVAYSAVDGHLSFGIAQQQYTILFYMYVREEWWCYVFLLGLIDRHMAHVMIMLDKMIYIKTSIINSRTCPVHPQRENTVWHNNQLV